MDQETPPPGQHLTWPCVPAAALNFKDVMLAYGKLNRDLMAAGFSKGALGFEFAGTRRERRVMGVAYQSIATSCGAPESMVSAGSANCGQPGLPHAPLTRGWFRMQSAMAGLMEAGARTAAFLCAASGCQVVLACRIGVLVLLRELRGWWETLERPRRVRARRRGTCRRRGA